MTEKVVVVQGQECRIKAMSYQDYIDLSREVVSKNVVSPMPKNPNDLMLFELFALILAFTGESMMNTAKTFMRTLAEKPRVSVA